MNGISWDDWRFVLAAFENGSFTAAAQALGVGQATLSRRIARVEDHLGHALFDRSVSGLRPTPQAHALRPHLQGLSAAADSVERALDGLEAQAVGEVSIAAPPGISADFLPDLALDLARTHPGIQLSVLALIGASDLERREADLALRMMPTHDSDLLSRRLLTVHAGLYASPDLIDQLPTPCSLDDVPIVNWAGEQASIPMSRFLDSLSERPIALRCNDYLVLRAAVVAGVGACLISTFEADRLGLLPVPVSLELGSVDLHLVVHRALRHVPRVAAVIDAIDTLIARYTQSSGQLKWFS